MTPSWRGDPPDLAVDLHGRGPQSHRALLALEPARLLAFDCPEVGHHGPRWRPDEHERARWCRLVADGLGVAADPDDVHLRSPDGPSPAPDAVVLHPGAGAPARQWPVDRFAAVSRHLRDEGHRVVLTGSKDERAAAGQVARLAGLARDAVLAGRTDLAELAALVSGARLVVSGDTGMAHLASAYAVPSVVLFGPVPPAEWGPPTDGPHTVLWSLPGCGTRRGDPHGGTVDPGLEAISVDDVLRAARARLAGVGAVPEVRPGRTTSSRLATPG